MSNLIIYRGVGRASTIRMGATIMKKETEDDELQELLDEIENDPTPINYYIMPDGSIKEVSEMTPEEREAMFDNDDDDEDETDPGEGGE